MSEQISELNDAIAGSFMQVQVTIRKWNGKAVDHSLSDEMESSKQARSGSLRTIKNLMAGADEELREVNSALDAIRTFTYNRTLPWASTSSGALRGPRLLPVQEVMPFLQDYKARVRTYEEAKQQFLNVYESRRDDAIANLGQAGKYSDYPDRDTIEAQFGAEIDIGVVPARNDFDRLPIPVAVADVLGSRMAQRHEAAIKNAMGDLFKRVLESVQRMATQLGKFADEGNARLYKTMVTSIRDINGLLRASNVTHDPKLTAVVDKIESQLCQHEVDAYKANVNLSKQVAGQATIIAKEVEDLIEYY